MVELLVLVGLGALAFAGIRYQLDFYKARRYKRGEVIHDDSEDDME